MKFGQGPLKIFDSRAYAQVFQGCLVPWLISRYGVAYKRDGSPDVVRDMLAALIERDDIGGLGKGIDLLKVRHAKAFDEIAKRAWSTALRAINQHRTKFREYVQQIFHARKNTDVVANAVVERVFGIKTLAPLLDLQSATLRHLAVGAPVPDRACIWESADTAKLGGLSILQNGNKLDTAGVDSLLDFLGECFIICLFPELPLTNCLYRQRG